MTINKKYVAWGAVGVTSIVLVLMFLRRKPETILDAVEDVTANAGTSNNNQFYDPFYYTTAGIPDLSIVLNGGDSPFNSQINVMLNNPMLGALSNKYIPMFGFVGVTAVGSQ